MWQPAEAPVHGSLALSALIAALPIFVVLFLLGVKRSPAWVAALAGLGAAMVVSRFAYGMPFATMLSAVISRTHAHFWQCFAALPEVVQRIAKEKYSLFGQDCFHPSLHFNPLRDDVWSVRVN